MQVNFKYPRIKKLHQVLEKITRIDQKVKILCVLLSHELLSTKIYYTPIYIFYLLFISRQVQKSKNYQSTTNTSKDTYKTFLLFYLNSFLFVLPLVLNTHYILVPPKNLSRGISEPRKTT